MIASSIVNSFKHIVEWSGKLVSWFALLMVMVTFTVVLLRYVFDTGSIALQESITYLHASIFLIGAAWTMQQDAHVRVDIFYARFNSETRAWVDLIGSLLLLLPVMVFITWVSWEAYRFLKTMMAPLSGIRMLSRTLVEALHDTGILNLY